MSNPITAYPRRPRPVLDADESQYAQLAARGIVEHTGAGTLTEGSGSSATETAAWAPWLGFPGGRR